MANATIAQSSNVLGRFIEKECGHVFEYCVTMIVDWMADLYPHQVYVGYLGEARIARVIKTRAFVVIDEDDEWSSCAGSVGHKESQGSSRK